MNTRINCWVLVHSFLFVCLLSGCCSVIDRDTLIRIVHEKDKDTYNVLWYLGSTQDTDVFVHSTMFRNRRLVVKPSIVEPGYAMKYVGMDQSKWKQIKPNKSLCIKHLADPDLFQLEIKVEGIPVKLNLKDL